MKTAIIIHDIPFTELEMQPTPLPGELVKIEDTWYTVDRREFAIKRMRAFYFQAPVKLYLK